MSHMMLSWDLKFYCSKECDLGIWCYHLLSGKSFKSRYKLLASLATANRWNVYVMKNNEEAHIIDVKTGKHAKIDLYELIPDKLVKSHTNYYQSLIKGYLRTIEEGQNGIPCIPFVSLKTLIKKYYPFF